MRGDGQVDPQGFCLVDALENIAAEMERLRVLKEYELGVRIEHAAEGGGPYVPRSEEA